jgi:Asp/Glu/hydantoin racemase
MTGSKMTSLKNNRFDIPDVAELDSQMGVRLYDPDDTAIHHHDASLLAIPGVVLVTRRILESGVTAIVVGVVDAATLDDLPKEIEGIPVHGEITGSIDAL